MNGTGIGEVRTKLLNTDHKQWNCGMGVFDPGVVFYKQDENGYVIIDGKRCKLVEKPDTSDPTVAILNGEVLENSFYKNPNDDIICSKMVDSISLPDGYNKCYYVYNTNLVSGTVPLISTNCILNKKYGHIYWSCKQKSPNTSPYGSTWRTGYIDENTNTTRCIMNSSNNKSVLLYSDMRAGTGGQNITNDTGIFGYEITDKKQYKALINDNEYHNMTGATQGQENNDNNLYFLSRCSDINLYYMFVIDDNKNVTSCFIPCQNATTGQFGLYEVVSNQFFGSDALTGVLLPKVKYIYEKIGDKIYKTVKIGNLQWMCENLDYKWDGLTIGDDWFGGSYSDPAAAYRDNDEATWGWNGRKAGLYYNKYCIQYMTGYLDYDHETGEDIWVPSVLPDGWRLATASEVESLCADDEYHTDKLFVPDCIWSTYGHPADAKMNETGLSLTPAGYWDTWNEEWSDLTNENVATINVSDGPSDGNSVKLIAPSTNSYGSLTYEDGPAPVRLVKDV